MFQHVSTCFIHNVSLLSLLNPFKGHIPRTRRWQVLGPYLKSGAPVLSSGIGWAGPGHCVVLDAGSGHDATWWRAAMSPFGG